MRSPRTFKRALLPVAAGGASAAVVLQLCALHTVAIEMAPYCFDDFWSDDGGDVATVTDAGCYEL